MVVGIITVQSALNGVTMKETVAQKRKGIAGLKETEPRSHPKSAVLHLGAAPFPPAIL